MSVLTGRPHCFRWRREIGERQFCAGIAVWRTCVTLLPCAVPSAAGASAPTKNSMCKAFRIKKKKTLSNRNCCNNVKEDNFPL